MLKFVLKISGISDTIIRNKQKKIHQRNATAIIILKVTSFYTVKAF